MTLNLSHARKAVVTARSPTTLELHVQLLLLLHAALSSSSSILIPRRSPSLISCGQSTLPLEIIARSFLMEARI